MTVTASTITENHAERGGGGIWNGSIFGTTSGDSHAALLSHTIVAGNWRTTDDNQPAADDLGGEGVFELGYSLVGTAVGAINTTPGTINYFGVDPLLGPLQDNGGPTLTHALLPGSPAIDAGDPRAIAGVGGVPLYDQRGATFDRVFGDRIDIGALEDQPPLADFDGNGTVSGMDFLAWQRNCGMTLPATKAEGDADGDLDVDSVDLALWEQQYGMAATPPTLSSINGGSAASDSAAAAVLADPGLVDAAMQPTDSPTRAELVDAALACSLTNSPADEEDLEVVVEPVAAEVAPTIRNSLAEPRTTSETTTTDAPTAAIFEAEKTTESWLTEELVEGEFRSII